MTYEKDLKPPFDVEFPDSERNLPESIERAIEQGTLTPRMVGYHSETTGEIVIPETPEEVDELTLECQKKAEKYGGHPNDYDWRYR